MSMRGADKVAALLLAMGKPAASPLLKHFDDQELKLITRSAAGLGPVSTSELESLVEEFAEDFSVGADIRVTAREVEKLLTGVLPAEQIAEIMSDIVGKPAEPVWEKVAATPEAALTAYAEKEHPQVAAYVLAKIDSASAATVLTRLQPATRNDIVRRMLRPKQAGPVAIGLLEGAIKAELLSQAESAGPATPARLADVLNKMERDIATELVDSLAEARPKETAALRGLLFSFEDIVRLDAKARTTLFDPIPADKVVLALRGTEQSFRELILASLGARARRMVETELADGGEGAPRQVAEARRSIADAALAMAARGEIELSPPEPEAKAA
jgi:flagellar motor switch protein FliG